MNPPLDYAISTSTVSTLPNGNKIFPWWPLIKSSLSIHIDIKVARFFSILMILWWSVANSAKNKLCPRMNIFLPKKIRWIYQGWDWEPAQYTIFSMWSSTIDWDSLSVILSRFRIWNQLSKKYIFYIIAFKSSSEIKLRQ